jgi:hypothetical protein
MSSIFKFFTSFDCTPAHDTAHLHLSSCLHMSGNPKFSENAISHKQKKQGITTTKHKVLYNNNLIKASPLNMHLGTTYHC